MQAVQPQALAIHLSECLNPNSSSSDKEGKRHKSSKKAYQALSLSYFKMIQVILKKGLVIQGISRAKGNIRILWKQSTRNQKAVLYRIKDNVLKSLEEKLNRGLGLSSQKYLLMFELACLTARTKLTIWKV